MTEISEARLRGRIARLEKVLLKALEERDRALAAEKAALKDHGVWCQQIADGLAHERDLANALHCKAEKALIQLERAQAFKEQRDAIGEELETKRTALDKALKERDEAMAAALQYATERDALRAKVEALHKDLEHSATHKALAALAAAAENARLRAALLDADEFVALAHTKELNVAQAIKERDEARGDNAMGADKERAAIVAFLNEEDETASSWDFASRIKHGKHHKVKP